MAISQQSPILPFIWAIVLLLFQHVLAFCSSSKLTILRESVAKFTGTCQTFQSPESLSTPLLTSTIWSTTSHLKSVNACLSTATTFPFDRINHARSEMIYQALHQGLQHPLKQKFLFPSAIIEYFNVITSSPLFQKSTHPGVVACVWRRSDRPPPSSSGVECLSWQIWEDKEFLSFISGKKWNGSRHLVLWSLGTLTGLRDQVRRLIA